MTSELYQPYYLSRLRESGVFTEGDILELEDHFFCVYEMELANGKTAPMALQQAERALGDREAIISAFAKKRKWAWLKDLGSFFVFGLVINLLGLWCLGIGFGNLFSILIMNSPIARFAPWLMPVIMGSFILLLSFLLWKSAIKLSVWHQRLPKILEGIRLKHILWPVIGVVIFALLTDPFVRFNIHLPEGQPAIWDTDWYDLNWRLWTAFFPVNMGLLALFFAWKAHVNRKKLAAFNWSIRFMVFFLAGWLSPFLNFGLIQFLASKYAANSYHLIGGLSKLSMAILLLEVALIICFPLAYRYIWKRKQFLV